MPARWGIYLAALLGSLVFYVNYQEWFSTVLLWLVLLLPWLSLLISLPAMRAMRITCRGAQVVTAGTEAVMRLRAHSHLPCMPFRGALHLRHMPTGKTVTLKSGGVVPTAHSGAVRIDPAGVWIFDCLGLFGFPVRFEEPCYVIVRPAPLPTAMPAGLDRFLMRSLRPKPGGGFSEQHEVRPYREGDSLSHIHWKLTAKAGQLMLREPMQPEHHRVLITLDWCGSADEIDRKGGRLRFIGQYMLEHDLTFEIAATVKDGLFLRAVTTAEGLIEAMDGLLCCEPTAEPREGSDAQAVSLQCHIGGEPDEA